MPPWWSHFYTSRPTPPSAQRSRTPFLSTRAATATPQYLRLFKTGLNATKGMIHFINYGAELSLHAACVISLTAAFNPDHRVVVWTSHPIPRDAIAPMWLTTTPPETRLLNGQSLVRLFQASPLLDWLKWHQRFWSESNVTERSRVLAHYAGSSCEKFAHGFEQNVANALRLVLLYRFGGVYIDSDIVPLQGLPLRQFGDATVTSQSDLPTRPLQLRPGQRLKSKLNNAFLAFPKEHPCLQYLMDALSKRRRPCTWGFYGPKLLTSAIARSLTDTQKLSCQTVTVLPYWTVAPEPWTAFRDLGPTTVLPVNLSTSRLDTLRRQGAFGVHLYNSADATTAMLKTKDAEITSSREGGMPPAHQGGRPEKHAWRRALQCQSFPRPPR